MCGIYGLWSSEHALPAETVARTLAHRGPDDAGLWHEGGLWLGHRRLSIIDLSAQGHQPISTPDGRYTLSYNGEIYNYLALRAELEAEGVAFTSETDTEVLLQGYAQWGEAVLDRLYGMFAFAIWDREAAELVLARDATGIKPLLYWQLGPAAFAFASEAKAFAHLPDVPFVVDEAAVREYLGVGYLWSDAHSVIEGVRKLPPGHLLRVREGVAGAPERWWQAPRPEVVTRPLAEALDAQADALYALLRTVTAEHLQADVPVGLLLSGGLDSSVLAALAARSLSEAGAGRLRTVTMGFEPYARDERPHARAVADYIGSVHTEVVVRPKDAAEELFANAHHFDDLFADSGTVPAFAAFEACRAQGLKVVLVGEGADELFGGYPPFRDLGARDAGVMPPLLHYYRFFRAYTRQRYGRHLPAFVRLIRRLHQEAGGDWFHTVRLFETQVQLPSSLNMKVDRASMAHSLEARVPYQDRRVVEFAFRIPRALLLGPRQGKRLLRHMARRYELVPEAILERRKMGTPVPWGWLTDGSAFAASARERLLAPGSWTHRLGLENPIRAFLEGRAWQGAQRVMRRLEPHGNLGWLAVNLLVLEAWSQSAMFAPRPAPPARPVPAETSPAEVQR